MRAAGVLVLLLLLAAADAVLPDGAAGPWPNMSGVVVTDTMTLLDEQGAGQTRALRPRLLPRHFIGTAAVIRGNGYDVEQHTVTTPDCYNLTLFRIPNKNGTHGTMVFFMHGILDSSAGWLVLGRGVALPFVLSDLGYDVYLGNARGNTASRFPSCRHDPDRDVEWWDFSFHEIGIYDVPSLINYALKNSNKSDTHYVGHSQGTTTFFVMASLVDGMMSKIRTANLLAPVVYLKCTLSLLMWVASIPSTLLWLAVKALGVPQLVNILPYGPIYPLLGDTLCAPSSPTQDVCYLILFPAAGFNWDQNRTVFPDFWANSPAGCSLKQMSHFGQSVHKRCQEFRQYDYGPAGNLARYQSVVPPSYNVSRATCNLTLVYSLNDYLGTKPNAQKLHCEIPTSKLVEVADPNFNHLDFMFGKHAKTLVFDGVVARIRSYDGL